MITSPSLSELNKKGIRSEAGYREALKIIDHAMANIEFIFRDRDYLFPQQEEQIINWCKDALKHLGTESGEVLKEYVNQQSFSDKTKQAMISNIGIAELDILLDVEKYQNANACDGSLAFKSVFRPAFELELKKNLLEKITANLSKGDFLGAIKCINGPIEDRFKLTEQDKKMIEESILIGLNARYIQYGTRPTQESRMFNQELALYQAGKPLTENIERDFEDRLFWDSYLKKGLST